MQLGACAKVAYLDGKTQFAPTDIRGRGIEAAVLYLEKVGAFDVKRDTAWQTICDLRDLRRLVVHRAGTKSESEEHRKTARRLAEAHQGHIMFPDSDWSWYGEVWIAIALCQEFITTIEGFFDRVFASLDLPPRFKADRLRGRQLCGCIAPGTTEPRAVAETPVHGRAHIVHEAAGRGRFRPTRIGTRE